MKLWPSYPQTPVSIVMPAFRASKEERTYNMMRIRNAKTKVVVAEIDDDGNMRYLDVNGNEKKYPDQVETEEITDAARNTDQV